MQTSLATRIICGFDRMKSRKAAIWLGLLVMSEKKYSEKAYYIGIKKGNHMNTKIIISSLITSCWACGY